jgi:4a-hydroxytetrahydrobiopterin dehydratase
MENLAKQSILSYTKYDSPIEEVQAEEYLKVLPDWQINERDGNPRLEKNYAFDDFVEAMQFANKVAEIAEEAHHHPDILISWGRCTVSWWTFVFKKLHENDFIMAARTEKLFLERAK